MSSLREIKDRIGSVRSTLKITSAMKLVASSKLRKAQRAIETLRPYESALNEILCSFPSAVRLPDVEQVRDCTAVVAVSSNSSLCGGFNANAVKKTLEYIRSCDGEVRVYAIGKKMAEALKRCGYISDADYSALSGSPDYSQTTALAVRLRELFETGEIRRVVLIYNHFVSTSHQDVVVEEYLPFKAPGTVNEAQLSEDDYIVEPSPSEIVEVLLPQVINLKLYAALLDSAAAEQAARTIAMQTASDNAEDLLSELTLEYNKGRQQKITSEILDLLGGSAD